MSDKFETIAKFNSQPELEQFVSLLEKSQIPWITKLLDVTTDTATTSDYEVLVPVSFERRAWLAVNKADPVGTQMRKRALEATNELEKDQAA